MPVGLSGFEFDPTSRRLAGLLAVTVIGPIEALILRNLLASPDRLLSHEEIASAIWLDAEKMPAEPEVQIRRAVRTLQNTFAIVGINSGCIEVVRREGYRFFLPKTLRLRRDLGVGLTEDLLPDETPVDVARLGDVG